MLNTYSRAARLWVGVFLVLSILCTAGALLARHNLDTLRETVIRELERQTGTQVAFKSLSLVGMKGLRIEEPSICKQFASGAVVKLDLPLAVAQVHLIDLLSGIVSVDTIHLDGATLQVLLPPSPIRSLRPSNSHFDAMVLLNALPFDIRGEKCSIELQMPESGYPPIRLKNVGFRLGSPLRYGQLETELNGDWAGDPYKRIQSKAYVTSLDDFFVRMQCSGLTAQDINPFLPSAQQVITEGSIQASLRLERQQGEPIAIELDASAEQIATTVTTDIPLPPSGHLLVQARYALGEKMLSITSAQLSTDLAAASFRGKVDMNSPEIELDLASEVQLLGSQELFDALFAKYGGPIQSYGELRLDFPEIEPVSLFVSGTLTQPQLTARLTGHSGAAHFVPQDKRYPKGELAFGPLEASWNYRDKTISGTVNLVGGSIDSGSSGFSATNLTGTVHLNNTQLEITPLAALVNGSPFSGSLQYDLVKKTGKARASGTLTAIEKTALATAIRHTELSGSVTGDIEAQLKPGIIQFSGSVNAGQTEVLYRTWFLKPSGLAGNANLTATLKLRKSFKLDAQVSAAGTSSNIELSMVHDGKMMRLMHALIKAESLDIATVGKSLRMPYTIIGGTATDCQYEWIRDPGAAPDGSMLWHSKGHCRMDDMRILANGATYPMHLQDVTLDSAMANGERSTGDLTIHAGKSSMPPLDAVYFVPDQIPPELLAKYPLEKRDYTYNLTTDSLDLPPWKGANFVGKAYMNDREAGFTSYEVDIEKGHMKGEYNRERKAETSRASNTWENIPCDYFIQYLRLPEVLRGNITGHVSYEKEKNDPNTLKGSGSFDITEGQFSADFLLFEFGGGKTDGDTSSLPPSLRFSTLSCDVNLNGRAIETPRINLESEGVKVTADGQFQPGGEMAYNVKLAIAPSTAEQMPVLQQYLNLEGHRLAQQDIELSLRLSGPTLKPQSTLAEAPSLSVTLVTGGLEVMSEAVKVVDIPRKVLVDLLKMGGGILGAPKTTAPAPKQE